MENTIENKEQFFAQYWGQIMIDHNGSVNIWNGLFDLRGCCLELTPLSSITDEDAVYIAKIEFGNIDYQTKWEGFNISNNDFSSLSLESTDYLRSKGYALPYMGIEVETLVKWGWIKLK